MAQDEPSIVGDDGELLKPDASSEYYEVRSREVNQESTFVAPDSPRRPMKIMLGLIVMVAIIGLAAICADISERNMTSYSKFSLKEEIERQSSVIETMEARLSATPPSTNTSQGTNDETGRVSATFTPTP
jgi:hypothetical protein